LIINKAGQIIEGKKNAGKINFQRAVTFILYIYMDLSERSMKLLNI